MAESSGGARRSSQRTLVPVLAGLTLLALSVLIVAASFYSMWRARARWDPVSSGAPLLVRDPVLGYVSPPSSTTRRRHRSGLEYSYHRDARGARVAVPTSAAPRQVDLVFVGGSFTLGRGVEYEQSFPAIVGRELGLSVENLGTGAYGTVQSLLLLERNADLAPSAVVYTFIEDHLRRNLSRCAPSLLPYCVHVPYVAFDERERPFLHPPDDGAEQDWARNERFHGALSAPPLGLASLRAGAGLLLRRFQGTPAPRVDGADHRLSGMRLLLGRMRQVAAGGRSRLLVVYVPDLRRPRESDPPPEELTTALGPGIELLDLSRTLRQAAETDPLTLPADDHPSAAGHRAIARAIAGVLRGLELQGVGAGSGRGERSRGSLSRRTPVRVLPGARSGARVILPHRGTNDSRRVIWTRRDCSDRWFAAPWAAGGASAGAAPPGC